MKRIVQLLAVMMMCLALCSCQIKKEQKDDIYIFFTSDVHCGVDENLTLASLKALVDDTKAEHPYVTLVDCGDYLQGGALGTLSKGSLAVELMNEMNYDIVTVGNHEFDYGMDELTKRLDELNARIVVSNAVYSGQKGNSLKKSEEYIIMDYDGTKVGFIGILTPTTITSSTPAFFIEDGEYVYDFYGGEDGEREAKHLQEIVDELRKQKVDYVIALSHSGTNIEERPYDAVSVISKTRGIDVFLDGHSHSLITEDYYPNADGEDVLLSSVGTKLQEAGELILGKDKTISVVHFEEYERQDEAILKAVEKAKGELNEILSQEICTIDNDISITDEEGIRMVRARETGAGDFSADALRYEMGTDIAIVNGGGVRATIPAGVVTYQSLLNVMPFQNILGSCLATGQQIMDALEFGAKQTEYIYKLDGNPVGEFGGFFQVSGLKYTVDTSIESSVMLDDNNMFAGFENDNRRVKDVLVLRDGEYVPIDPKAYYSVAASNYALFRSGDGNTIFSECERIIEEGPVDVLGLIDFCQSEAFIPENYMKPDGRITIE